MAGSHGTQKVVVEETNYPLHFNGKVMFWSIFMPTADKLETLSLFEVTTPNLPNHFLDDVLSITTSVLKLDTHKNL